MHPAFQTILAGLTFARFDDPELEGCTINALKNLSADLLSVSFEPDTRTQEVIDKIEKILREKRIQARAEIKSADEDDIAATPDEDNEHMRGKFDDNDDAS